MFFQNVRLQFFLDKTVKIKFLFDFSIVLFFYAKDTTMREKKTLTRQWLPFDRYWNDARLNEQLPIIARIFVQSLPQ